MKKITLFSLLAFSIVAKAQKAEWLGAMNRDSCKIMADYVASNFIGHYKLKTVSEKNNGNGLYLEFLYESDSFKDAQGKPAIANVLFENVEGTKRYSPFEFQGKFSEVFPIWKKYVDEKADLSVVSKKRYVDKTIVIGEKDIKCLLRNEDVKGDNWSLLLQ